MNGPLAGVKVLDLTAALSGPMATQILGDMGADIIKIESPEGDSIRGLGPSRHAGMGPMFLHCNRNKRSVVLDLKSKGGRDAFLKLADTVDVIVCNTRPQAMARLGLDYAQLAERLPSIIYVSIVGFSSSGPWAGKPAYDDLIQAAAAIPSLHAEHEAGRYTPIAFADRTTGLFAANAVLGALYHRTQTGAGQHIEIPMFETIAALVLSDHMGGRTFDPPTGPTRFERYASVRRPFATQDGQVCLMVLTDRQWRTLFAALGHPELADDVRFQTVSQRDAHIEALYSIVAKILETRSTDDWLATLGAADIPVGRVETIESLIDHPHLAGSGFFEWIDHPTEGTIRSIAKTSSWSRTQPGYSRPAPLLGEHTLEVLSEAGLDRGQINELLESGEAVQST
jgi:crotonobetainyl-CoA:carnitine CoA-transferase CaiB-like acyl-CoA transferase